MEKVVMIIMIMFALGINHWSCTGLPRYADPLVDDAFNASVSAANARIHGRFLYRPYKSSLKNESVAEDNSRNLFFEFYMQKTVCRKRIGANPFTCAFQRRTSRSVVKCESRATVIENTLYYAIADCFFIWHSDSTFQT
ncbi:secreted phosphoprotein 24-like [Tupaia chinensis]|uniref:secreted phosphoprotein 24-like n=1 Tax=Tupaia chinensis TaxID=246437 RepID=UPI0003C8EE9E|nr:secreted phosphoprotein 24-like [Tupaia chinensis]XP_006162880.1 secreted phosphoprotein 24-like [Tupaia chinensis]